MIRMVKDLIKIKDVPHYIFQKTGITITEAFVRFWVDFGELPLVKPLDKDKRFSWTLKRYVDQMIERYSE